MITTVKTKTSLYSCALCKKGYTRKGSLDKHIVLCEFKSKSKLELQVAVEEASDKPTYDQLVQIVQELSIKYVKMEEKMMEMQQYIDRKKKKVDVISWLNIHQFNDSLIKLICNFIIIIKQLLVTFSPVA